MPIINTANHALEDQLFSKSDAILEESLNQRLQRQLVISSNITNSMTPGYRALAYNFENQLQAAVDTDQHLHMKVDDPRHIQTPGLMANGDLKPDLFVDPTESIGNDGNTVDVDKQMALAAQTKVLYQATLESLNRQLGMLRYGIHGGNG